MQLALMMQQAQMPLPHAYAGADVAAGQMSEAQMARQLPVSSLPTRRTPSWQGQARSSTRGAAAAPTAPAHRTMLTLLAPLAAFLLDATLRPQLQRLAAAAAAPLALPLPASAASAATTLLASRGDGSQGLFASVTRDFDDVYYGLLLVAALVWVGQKVVSGLLQDAKDFDRRGELANRAAAEMKKRERKENTLTNFLKRSEPATYDRLQKESEERARKKGGWKLFPVDDE